MNTIGSIVLVLVLNSGVAALAESVGVPLAPQDHEAPSSGATAGKRAPATGEAITITGVLNFRDIPGHASQVVLKTNSGTEIRIKTGGRGLEIFELVKGQAAAEFT